MPKAQNALTGTLEILKKETSGHNISVKKVAKTLNSKGFGSLLLAPAIVSFLPTGAIPGVPAACAIFIGLVSAQIIAGRDSPWIPQRLAKISFKRKRMIAAINKAKPYTKRIDRYVRPRLTLFCHPLVQKLIALACLALAFLMLIFGFIPFMPAIISLPIIFFALGLSAHDGLMTIAGIALTIIAAIGIFTLATPQ